MNYYTKLIGRLMRVPDDEARAIYNYIDRWYGVKWEFLNVRDIEDHATHAMTDMMYEVSL